MVTGAFLVLCLMLVANRPTATVKAERRFFRQSGCVRSTILARADTGETKKAAPTFSAIGADRETRYTLEHRQGSRQGNLASGRRERCLPTPLVQIQILSPVNHCARRSRPSRSALMVGRPRCDRYDDHRQRKNHREPKCEAIWFRCHLFPSGQPTEVPWRSLEAESGEMCELLHTLLPGISVTMLFRLARGGTG